MSKNENLEKLFAITEQVREYGRLEKYISEEETRQILARITDKYKEPRLDCDTTLSPEKLHRNFSL